MAAGAPTKFTDELFESILNDLRYSDKGVVTVCKSAEINPDTFYTWLKDSPELADKYARAREGQAEFMADQILAIADDSVNDTIDGEYGPIENKEWVNRSKLRIEARKWLAAKLAPKKYGDKNSTEITGSLNVTQITGMEIK